MRTMMKITIPAEAGNRAIHDGRLGGLLEQTFERLKPEAAYFPTAGGPRQAIFVFDLADVSDLPRIAEPFFQELLAEVEFCPVMNADDMKAGLAKMAG